MRLRWKLMLIPSVMVSLFVSHVLLFPFHPMVSFDGATSYLRYFENVKFREMGTVGYPIFVQIIKIFTSDPVLAGQLTSAIFASLLILPLYGLLKRYVEKRYHIWAILAVILNPLIFRYGMITMSDMTGLFFFCLTIYLFVVQRYLLCGVALWVAYLTRPELLFLFPILVAVKFSNSKMLQLSIFIPLFMLSAVWISIDRGDLMFTNKQSMHPDFSNYISNLIGHSWNIVKYGGLVIVGAWAVFTKKRTMLALGLLILFILPAFPMLLVAGRYVMIPIFCLIFLSFVVLGRFSNSLSRLGIMLVFLCYLPSLSTITSPDEVLPGLKEAGMSMQAFVKSGDRFYDRKPYTAFYANGIYEEMPNVPLDSMIRYGEERNIKFIVVSAIVMYNFRPQLKRLVSHDTIVTNKYSYTKVYLSPMVKIWQRQ